MYHQHCQLPPAPLVLVALLVTQCGRCIECTDPVILRSIHFDQFWHIYFLSQLELISQFHIFRHKFQPEGTVDYQIHLYAHFFGVSGHYGRKQMNQHLQLLPPLQERHVGAFRRLKNHSEADARSKGISTLEFRYISILIPGNKEKSADSFVSILSLVRNDVRKLPCERCC